MKQSFSWVRHRESSSQEHCQTQQFKCSVESVTIWRSIDTLRKRPFLWTLPFSKYPLHIHEGFTEKKMSHCNMTSLCTQRRMRLTSHLVTSSPFISHVEQITSPLGRALLFSYLFCIFSCVFSVCLPSSTAPVPCLRSSLVGTSSRRGHTSSPRCRCASNFSILFSSHSTYSIAHTVIFRCRLSVLMFQFSAPLVLLTCLLLGAHLNYTTT